ncbi:phage baseplate plug family protein [Paraburkholderia sediminicola]|uniref:phage baseplate plug family protein n=1 Tax=Paraburkholderia sediminicola TaxID=458836 RepID=UPI0038BDD6D7
MTTHYEIPLSPEPQTFTIALAGTTYGFTVGWNAPNASWMIDIADASGNPILSGIPMVTGADLLEQYGYLSFGFALVAQTDNAPDVVPTFATLGQTSHLYAITNP